MKRTRPASFGIRGEARDEVVARLLPEQVELEHATGLGERHHLRHRVQRAFDVADDRPSRIGAVASDRVHRGERRPWVAAWVDLQRDTGPALGDAGRFRRLLLPRMVQQAHLADEPGAVPDTPTPTVGSRTISSASDSTDREANSSTSTPRRTPAPITTSHPGRRDLTQCLGSTTDPDARRVDDGSTSSNTKAATSADGVVDVVDTGAPRRS